MTRTTGGFGRFLTARAVSWAGSAVTTVALPVLLYQRTGSAALSGLLSALEALPYLLLGLPAGALADRWDRRGTMTVCGWVSAALVGAVPLASAAGTLTTAQLLLTGLVLAGVFVFFDAAAFGALPQLVGRDGIAAATGRMMTVSTLVGLAGPTAAGVLIAALDAPAAITVDALSYAAAALLLARVPLGKRDTAAGPGAARDAPGDAGPPAGAGAAAVLREAVPAGATGGGGGLNAAHPDTRAGARPKTAAPGTPPDAAPPPPPGVATPATPGTPGPGAGPTPAALREDIREGLRFIRRHPLIRPLTLLGVGNSFTEGAVVGLIVVSAVRHFGLSDDDRRIGLFWAAAALGALAAASALPRLRRAVPAGWLTLGGLGANCVFLACWALAPGLPTGLAALACWQAANTLVSLNGIVIRQESTPDRLQGRVNTTARMIAWGGQPFGAAGAGVLAQAYGVRTALLLACAGSLLAFAAGLATPLRTSTGRHP